MRYLLETQKPRRRRKKRRLGAYLLLVLALIAIGGSILWIHDQKQRGAVAKPEPSSSSREAAISNPPPSIIRSAETKPPIVQPTAIPPAVGLKPEVPAVNPQVAKAGSAGFAERPVQNVLEAQLVLARAGFSSGSMDGAMGSQTRSALRAFQESRKLPATGSLDLETRQALRVSATPLTTYRISSNDLARLQPLPPDWVGKSEQPRLDYETILELAAEKGWSHPALIKQLNPGVDWTNVSAGTEMRIPNVERPAFHLRPSFLQISLSEKTLEAFDAATNLLLHFPCSIAQRVEKRPVGELHVAVVALNPDYIFDPVTGGDPPGL